MIFQPATFDYRRVIKCTYTDSKDLIGFVAVVMSENTDDPLSLIDPPIIQEILNYVPPFGGSKQCKYIVILEDFPYNSAIVWVGSFLVYCDPCFLDHPNPVWGESKDLSGFNFPQHEGLEHRTLQWRNFSRMIPGLMIKVVGCEHGIQVGEKKRMERYLYQTSQETTTSAKP